MAGSCSAPMRCSVPSGLVSFRAVSGAWFAANVPGTADTGAHDARMDAADSAVSGGASVTPGVCPFTVDRPIMRQRWERLTFLHWSLRSDPGAATPAGRPAGRAFDGAAWSGWCRSSCTLPPAAATVPWVSISARPWRGRMWDSEGRSGIWFFSLDAARTSLRWPSRGPPTGCRTSGPRCGSPAAGRKVSYTCLRRWPGPRDATSQVRISVGGPFGPGDLDERDHSSPPGGSCSAWRAPGAGSRGRCATSHGQLHRAKPTSSMTGWSRRPDSRSRSNRPWCITHPESMSASAGQRNPADPKTDTALATPGLGLRQDGVVVPESRRRPAVGMDALASWCRRWLGAPPRRGCSTGYLSTVKGFTVWRMAGGGHQGAAPDVAAGRMRAGAPSAVDRRVSVPQPLVDWKPLGSYAATAGARPGQPASSHPTARWLPRQRRPRWPVSSSWPRTRGGTESLAPSPSWTGWDHAEPGLWPTSEELDVDLNAYPEPRWLARESP